MAISRGKAHDGPQIAMRVDKGRLVPVSPFDLELLDQWRDGAILNVSPVLAQIRPLERRYFAMLTKLLKTADTPWSNTETAHEALKLAAGFSDPYRKKTGEWGAHPRSITTFTDKELSEYFEIFLGIVQERFGVDPETLGQEASDTGDAVSSVDQPVNTSDPDGAPGADPIPVGVGEPSATTSVDHPAGVAPEADGGFGTPHGPPSAKGLTLSKQDLDWLKQVARMLTAATAPGGGLEEVDTIDRQKLAIKQYLTPGEISPEARDLAQHIYRYCKAATASDGPFEREWIAHLAGCKVSDLKPESR